MRSNGKCERIHRANGKPWFVVFAAWFLRHRLRIGYVVKCTLLAHEFFQFSKEDMPLAGLAAAFEVVSAGIQCKYSH